MGDILDGTGKCWIIELLGTATEQFSLKHAPAPRMEWGSVISAYQSERHFLSWFS
jgi:hypothetical protein